MDVIRTMIVEDEALILRSIVQLVDWKAYGFELVATALNGLIGMKQFARYKPDLILTDIKMPGISGLEMIRQIHETDPQVKFMVISSYSEFEYAKESLKMGAEDYILKSELSVEYLAAKLTAFKTAHFQEQDIRRESLENRLSKMFSEVSKLTVQEIHTLFEPPYRAVILSYPDYYYTFILEILKKQYQQYQMLHLFHARPLETDTAPDDLESRLQEETVRLRDLINACSSQNYSSPVIAAMNYINHHYQDPDLTISEIAEEIGISTSRLCVIFKNDTGQTIKSFLTDKRISEATRLLYLKNLKVYEVADKVGYKTSQYFSKIFYQKTGQYPNDYRNRIIKPEA